MCPLDHVFEPFHFDDRTNEHGMPLSFREHSFLENSLTPATIKNSVVPPLFSQDRAAFTVPVPT